MWAPLPPARWWPATPHLFRAQYAGISQGNVCRCNVMVNQGCPRTCLPPPNAQRGIACPIGQCAKGARYTQLGALPGELSGGRTERRAGWRRAQAGPHTGRLRAYRLACAGRQRRMRSRVHQHRAARPHAWHGLRARVRRRCELRVCRGREPRPSHAGAAAPPKGGRPARAGAPGWRRRRRRGSKQGCWRSAGRGRHGRWCRTLMASKEHVLDDAGCS